MQTVQQFIKDDWYTNSWVKHPKLQLYVRSGSRLSSPTKMDYSFEIANVTAKKPGCGHFTEFLNELEEMLKGTKFKLLFIENVREPRFQRFFERRNFEKYCGMPADHCYIKGIN